MRRRRCRAARLCTLPETVRQAGHAAAGLRAAAWIRTVLRAGKASSAGSCARMAAIRRTRHRSFCGHAGSPRPCRSRPCLRPSTPVPRPVPQASTSSWYPGDSRPSGRGVLARSPAFLAWASAARSARQSCPTARSGYSASPASAVAWSRWAISSAPRPGLRGRRGRRPGRLTSRHSQTDPVGDRAPSESVACGPGPRSCRASCRAERRGP